MFDLSHNNPLPAGDYAGDAKLFAMALGAGWIAVAHKLTQGSAFKDRVGVGRLQVAAQTGLAVAGYHFMTTEPVSSQVANFMHQVGLVKTTAAKLVLILDNEPGPGNPVAGMTAATAETDARAAEFVTAVYQATGVWPLVYGGRWSFYSPATCGNLLACPLWLAEYGTTPNCPPGWVNWMFHQFTDGTVRAGLPPGDNTLTVPGIGNVDQSTYAGAPPEMLAWWATQ